MFKQCKYDQYIVELLGTIFKMDAKLVINVFITFVVAVAKCSKGRNY